MASAEFCCKLQSLQFIKLNKLIKYAKNCVSAKKWMQGIDRRAVGKSCMAYACVCVYSTYVHIYSM